jgi:hypothetical protein
MLPHPSLPSLRDAYAIGLPATFDDSGLHTIPNSIAPSIRGSAGTTPRSHTSAAAAAAAALSSVLSSTISAAAAPSAASSLARDASFHMPVRRPSLNLPPPPPIYDPDVLTTRSESAANQRAAAAAADHPVDSDMTPRADSVCSRTSAASAAAAALSLLLSSTQVPSSSAPNKCNRKTVVPTNSPRRHPPSLPKTSGFVRSRSNRSMRCRYQPLALTTLNP